MVRSAQPLPPFWLTSETLRSVLATVVAVVVSVPVNVLTASEDGTHLVDGYVLTLAVFQVAYVVLTIALLRSPHLLTWAEQTRTPTWVQRWVYLTQPGAGLALAVSAFAMVVAATLAASDVADRSTWSTLAGFAFIVGAWPTMTLSFTLDYLCRDARHGYHDLAFPGQDDGEGSQRSVADYVYFAIAGSTTFGATDVTVQTTRMRRVVTMHAVVAFVFNTVVLAVTLGALT